MSNISSTMLQKAYVDLYKELRNYIWDFRVVDTLTDLEVETFQTFPNVSQLRRYLLLLKQQVSGTDAMNDNESMNKAFDKFEELLAGDDLTVYSSLETFREVIV